MKGTGLRAHRKSDSSVSEWYPCSSLPECSLFFPYSPKRHMAASSRVHSVHHPWSPAIPFKSLLFLTSIYFNTPFPLCCSRGELLAKKQLIMQEARLEWGVEGFIKGGEKVVSNMKWLLSYCWWHRLALPEEWVLQWFCLLLRDFKTSRGCLKPLSICACVVFYVYMPAIKFNMQIRCCKINNQQQTRTITAIDCCKSYLKFTSFVFLEFSIYDVQIVVGHG